MDKKVKDNVERLFYDNYRVRGSGKPQALNIYQNNNGKFAELSQFAGSRRSPRPGTIGDKFPPGEAQ